MQQDEKQRVPLYNRQGKARQSSTTMTAQCPLNGALLFLVASLVVTSSEAFDSGGILAQRFPSCLQEQFSASAQRCQHKQSRRLDQVSFRRPWGQVESSTTLYSDRDKSGDKSSSPKPSGWDAFKNVVYGSVDAVDSLASKVKGDKPEPTVKPQTQAPISPAEKIRLESEQRAQSVDISTPSPADTKPKLKPFDALKETVYSTVDASSQLLSKSEKPTSPVLDRAVAPIAPAPADKGLTSTNPIERFKAEQRVREEEARKRAAAVQKKAEDIKSGVYDVADSIGKTIESVEKTIESIPQKAAETKKAAVDFSEWVKTIPDQVAQAAKEVKAIPTRVTNKAKETKDGVETRIRTTKENVETSIRTTKETVETGIKTTKQVVEDVQDLPNKVVRTVDAAKKKVSDTKASVDETVTNVKVLVGLEKPKPKPPKIKPPEPPTASKIALDLVGSVIKGGASFVWWVGKGTVAFAWDRAQEILDNRPKQLTAGKTTTAAAAAPEVSTKAATETKPKEAPASKETPAPEMSKEASAPEKPKETPAPAAPKAIPVPKEPVTLTANDDSADDIQKEVEDALRAAEESLNRAKGKD